MFFSVVGSVTGLSGCTLFSSREPLPLITTFFLAVDTVLVYVAFESRPLKYALLFPLAYSEREIQDLATWPARPYVP